MAGVVAFVRLVRMVPLLVTFDSRRKGSGVRVDQLFDDLDGGYSDIVGHGVTGNSAQVVDVYLHGNGPAIDTNLIGRDDLDIVTKVVRLAH